MAEFNAADYGIDWPTTPRDIVAEALREYLGDGEGVDGAIFAAFVDEVRAPLEAERDDLESRLADLLCDLTDGRMSKTNYDVRTMVQEVEAAFERDAEEARKEARNEAFLEAAEIVENAGDYGYEGWIEDDLRGAADRLRTAAEAKGEL